MSKTCKKSLVQGTPTGDSAPRYPPSLRHIGLLQGTSPPPVAKL